MKDDKKRALSLGIRIGVVFLFAIVIMICITYYVLSQNFHNLLTDYTIQLIQTMVNQGVGMVEDELYNSRKDAELMASIFQLPEDNREPVSFGSLSQEKNVIRFVFVTELTTVASDGRTRDVSSRQDIQNAFQGENSVYGPYYNEENEFVVCYSSPVRKDGEIVGVLSIEKDGYNFCSLIKDIRFVNSGESYIINAEGTDIAVSDPAHIEWVTSEYNAQELLDGSYDEETQSILKLERNGLQGESGVGTYYWENGLCYVVYAPIPSTGWVLLAGLREEEIASMTQSTLYSAVSKGPALAICLVLFFFLTGLIIFWIISNTKRNAEINQKLETIANHDSLTGLLNRRFLENSLAELWTRPIKIPSRAAIFMLDIDNFKQYNDILGHPKGDECLQHIATIFKHAFDGYQCNVMRYGGEEFIAAVFQIDQQDAFTLGQKICQLIENDKLPNGKGGIVTVSIGICFVDSTQDITLTECIKNADKALYKAKESGKNKAVSFDSLYFGKEAQESS